MKDLRVTKSEGPAHAFPTECRKKYSGLNELLVELNPEGEKESTGANYSISSDGQTNIKNKNKKRSPTFKHQHFCY